MARQQTSRFALFFVLFQAAILYQNRREWSRVQDYLEAVEELEAVPGGVHAIPGHYLQGWVLTMQGQVDQGISLMRHRLADLSSRGHWSLRPYSLTLLVEAYLKLDCIADGLSALSDGLSQIDTMGIYFYDSEIHRLKGELLLQQSSDHTLEAESCYQKALEISHHQEAKFFELRAATSLSRLWQSQDKRQDAHDLLASVYSWFTEGFDTADLIDAKTLLAELLEGQ